MDLEIHLPTAVQFYPLVPSKHFSPKHKMVTGAAFQMEILPKKVQR